MKVSLVSRPEDRGGWARGSGQFSKIGCVIVANFLFVIYNFVKAFKKKQRDVFFFLHKNNKRRSKSAASPYSKKLLGAFYYLSQLIIS